MSTANDRLSQPRHALEIEKDVQIRMRDGAALYADIFRPQGKRPHRKLDPALTLPYRPYHAHNERWWLKPRRGGGVRDRDLAGEPARQWG